MEHLIFEWNCLGIEARKTGVTILSQTSPKTGRIDVNRQTSIFAGFDFYSNSGLVSLLTLGAKKKNIT